MAETAERPSSPTAACPRCGADAEADQLFCLSCGERLNLGYRPPPTWRLPAGIVAAVVALTGAAVAFALVQVSDDADRVAGPPVQPPAAETDATGTAPAGETETTEDEDDTPSPGRGSDELAEWPADTSAYTVILLSTNTEEGARATARQAAAAGIPAGVLDSSDYSSLNPGFQVVFAGEFDSVEEAQEAAERYAGLGFAGGYGRFVNGGE